MVKLRPDADLAVVAEVQAGLLALNTPGTVRYTIGDDLGLREGNWGFALVADFESEAAYREYDLDEEHNRLRARLAPHTEQVARLQFHVD